MGSAVKNVMIVDDDGTQLLIASKHLSSPNRNVVAVKSGREALHKMLVDRFDVLICDYNMPEMDGLHLLKMMKELAIKCPTILVTGSEDLAAINAAYRLGISTFTSKPVNWPVLRGQVDTLLEH